MRPLASLLLLCTDAVSSARAIEARSVGAVKRAWSLWLWHNRPDRPLAAVVSLSTDAVSARRRLRLVVVRAGGASAGSGLPRVDPEPLGFNDSFSKMLEIAKRLLRVEA
ncbi:hypothetical protein WKR88_15470 [Trinickia caryophylli]|uniref:hypothetical protein n=1 Tax=Trinickia caryophylli TaxID=28094 RepID=UPI000A164111|nr:hypothetical protein [Trinickia caryophylli]PMS12738.1 hypothetical protein C0Z17_07870 [Trinickia caryophylli]TRX15144.1 hypothetical protein FNF07_28535 [Trinickia caryophylli]WQE15008.1 hypothetical protein U0034_20865 [Trinickia caryophylli]GLU31261.1 hypothetical protein Busp01_11030 [Trinickia caryophylli]